MSEYPWNEKNNTFAWFSSLYNPFKAISSFFHDGFPEGTSWSKHNILKVIKDDLVLKALYHQLQENQKWYSVVVIEGYEDFH